MKFSIIVPVYNAAGTLKRCLDSLLCTGSRDMEILLVDDGSTDATAKIYEKYEKDARLAVFRTENNGPSAARNLALQHAAGDFICFVDADDCLEPQALNVLAQTIFETKVDLILYGYKQVIRGRESDKEIAVEDGIYEGTKLEAFRNDFLYSPENRKILPYLWLRAIRREVVVRNNLKFDEQVRRGEDYLFLADVHRHIKKMAVIAGEHKLYRYYYENKSITNSYVKDFDKMVFTTYSKLEGQAPADRIKGMLVVRCRLCVMNEICSSHSVREKIRYIRRLYQNETVKRAVAYYAGRQENCGIPIDFFFMKHCAATAAYLYHSVRYRIKVILRK